MLKLLLDENLRSDALWQAIAAQCETVKLPHTPDIKRVGGSDAPALRTPDDVLIEMSAAVGRVLVTLDKTTMPNFFDEFLKNGGQSPGVIVLHGNLSIRQIAELLIMISCLGDASEFADQCKWIP